MSRPSLKTIALSCLEILNAGGSPQRASQAIAAYLVAERRTGELEALVRIINGQRAADGVHEATVTSAFSIGSDIRTAVDALIRAQQAGVKLVVINANQDSSVIGGLRVETHELLLDTTISSKLKHLYQLTNAA